MDKLNTRQAADDPGRYVDPADLICPGCTEQVRCEPPGYWRVAWGLPRACPRPASPTKTRRPCARRFPPDRPAEPVEIDRA